MLTASFLSWRDDRPAQLVADIANADAIPEDCSGFYVWTFQDGSRLVITGLPLNDFYSRAMAFDADGVEMHSVDLAGKVSPGACQAGKDYRFGKTVKDGAVRWTIA